MTKKRLIPLVLMICVTSAELTVKEEKPSEPVSQCLLHIINHHLNNSKKLAVRYSDDQRQKIILHELFKQTDNPIMANADEHPKGIELDERIPSDATIILGEDVNVTEHLESNLYTAATVFFTVFWSKSEEIGKTFDVFWNYNVVNTYALDVKTDGIYVYEYVPYANCYTNEPVLLDVWFEEGFRYGRIDRIKKTPLSHVNGCTLTVAVPFIPPTIIFPDLRKIHGTTVIGGVEGNMWNTISEKINSTFWYKVPDDGKLWGFVKPPTGAVGELIQKRAHFSGGGPSTTLARLAYLDAVIGSSGTSDTVVWTVPKGAAKSHPVWLKIFLVEFSSMTWVCLALILSLTVVTHSVFTRITNTSPTSGLFDSFLILFAVSLRGPAKTPESMSLKMLMASWMWYTLIIMTAYESVMRSSLTVPIRHEEVNTLREVSELDIDLYGVDTTIKIVLTDTNDPYKEAIGKKVKVWNSSIEEIMIRITRDRNCAYMREKLTLDYFLFNHKEYLGNIHQVKQYLYFYYQTIYTTKRFPIFPRVKSIISYLRDSGICKWWKSLYTRESYPVEPQVVKLTTEHMTAPFTILGIGTMLATIAFVAEHWKYRRMLKRRTRREKLWINTRQQ